LFRVQCYDVPAVWQNVRQATFRQIPTVPYQRSMKLSLLLPIQIITLTSLGMKKTILLSVFALCAQLLAAQQPVKKYVLIEHFTNSVCSSCASRNPALFSLILQPQNASELHHISIHPQFPYASCVFYQANTVENNARASYYNISGTPTLAINGTFVGGGNPLLSQTKLNTYLNQTSPVYVRVFPETGSGSQKDVKIKVQTVGTVPGGNYRLRAILLEKTINLQTPNGEPVHHNVLRDVITSPAGEAYTAAPLGQSVEYNLSYTPNAAWNASELYILAFLQNDAKDVLNSGTKFDPITSGTRDAAVQNISIQPNPAQEVAFAQISEDVVKQVEMFAVNGQRTVLSFQEQQGQIELPVAALTPGIYIVKMTGEKGVYIGKLVKN